MRRCFGTVIRRIKGLEDQDFILLLSVDIVPRVFGVPVKLPAVGVAEGIGRERLDEVALVDSTRIANGQWPVREIVEERAPDTARQALATEIG